jgi:hypothetical protein
MSAFLMTPEQHRQAARRLRILAAQPSPERSIRPGRTG